MPAKVYTAADARDPNGLWRILKPVAFLSLASHVGLATLNGAELAIGASFLEDPFVQLTGITIGVTNIVALLIAIFLTCRLTFRLMRNLHAWQAPVEMMSPFWSVAWYFVPFANYWIPFRAVRQMQKGADALLLDVPSAESNGTGSWWLTWVIGTILGNISLRLMDRSGGLGGAPTDAGLYQAALVTGAISSGLLVLSCIWFVGVFDRLVNAQSRIQPQQDTSRVQVSSS
jgi:hypothetical protein